MESWKLFLVLSFTVCAVACLDLEESAPRPVIVCHVSIYPEISDAIQEKLVDCDHAIVSYDGLCDLAKYFLNFSDAIRIASIRSRAPHAKILRQVEVKFDENFDPILAVHNVQASLAAGPFDGVELVFDSAHLDQHEQIKYAQFLKMLKQSLDDHVLISNSFVCNQQLPAFLLNAMSEVLDYVILLPSSQNAFIEGSALESRVYSGSVANCLLGANFPRNKIVLGLPTGGKLVDSSVHRDSPSNLIPYGNVCELHEEQQRHCEEQLNQDCSLFEDGVKLIYDDPSSAGRRALQCVGCKLKGVSIALSYDDSAGICVGSSFPLLSAIQNVFEYRSGVLGFYGCPPDSGESDVGSNEMIQSAFYSYSIENNHLDSEMEGDCSCAHGKLCNGCPLRKRLEGTLKSSENVARMSKDVTEKVLESLDRAVTLVSFMLQYRSKFPLVSRISPSLEHVGPPVIQPDEHPSLPPSINSGLPEEVDPIVPTGQDPVQSDEANPVLQPGPAVEVDPIQQSGFDSIQIDGETHYSPSEPEIELTNEETLNHKLSTETNPDETDEENHDSPSESQIDLVNEETLNQKLPTETNPDRTDEENHDSQPEPEIDLKNDETLSHKLPTETNLDRTDEENHDSPSEPEIDLTNEETLNQKLSTETNPDQIDEENRDFPSETALGLTNEETQNPPPEPDLVQTVDDNHDLLIETNTDQTDEVNPHPPSGQDSIITVEENQSSRYWPEYVD